MREPDRARAALQHAHDELPNSSQLPLRPDMEFNMQFILELSLESSSPTGGGSCEPQDLPVERYRRAPGRSLLRWLAGLGPEPECHLNHSLCPATCTSHSHGTRSAL